MNYENKINNCRHLSFEASKSFAQLQMVKPDSSHGLPHDVNDVFKNQKISPTIPPPIERVKKAGTEK